MTGIYDTCAGRLEIRTDGGYITGVSFAAGGRPAGTGERSALADEAARQINEYLNGTRRTFSVPVRAEGTEFQKKIWRTLSEIPYGETRSYKEVAALAGFPAACRAAGTACGRNQVLILIPCHRAVRADGTPGGYAAGVKIKARLLEIESRASETKK